MTSDIQGQCAICHTNGLDYSKTPTFNNDELYFEYECENGHFGQEYYELTYIETIGEKE